MDESDCSPATISFIPVPSVASLTFMAILSKNQLLLKSSPCPPIVELWWGTLSHCLLIDPWSHELCRLDWWWSPQILLQKPPWRLWGTQEGLASQLQPLDPEALRPGVNYSQRTWQGGELDRRCNSGHLRHQPVRNNQQYWCRVLNETNWGPYQSDVLFVSVHITPAHPRKCQVWKRYVS